jgi:hypothetical protein
MCLLALAILSRASLKLLKTIGKLARLVSHIYYCQVKSIKTEKIVARIAEEYQYNCRWADLAG